MTTPSARKPAFTMTALAGVRIGLYSGLLRRHARSARRNLKIAAIYDTRPLAP